MFRLYIQYKEPTWLAGAGLWVQTLPLFPDQQQLYFNMRLVVVITLISMVVLDHCEQCCKWSKLWYKYKYDEVSWFVRFLIHWICQKQKSDILDTLFYPWKVSQFLIWHECSVSLFMWDSVDISWSHSSCCQVADFPLYCEALVLWGQQWARSIWGVCFFSFLFWAAAILTECSISFIFCHLS